ncbi:hypothetical protein B0H17DRAFT_1187429 [Mycena rosella]|uniref:Uncharacterized protein n=1 Tax=Mycena rosella TaxID=1033263 RepID=A0AAD7C2R4_MYCRO|nr:hypothetical protein B0H17DRAFT_1187429 [Mycena rosella]
MEAIDSGRGRGMTCGLSSERAASPRRPPRFSSHSFTPSPLPHAHPPQDAPARPPRSRDLRSSGTGAKQTHGARAPQDSCAHHPNTSHPRTVASTQTHSPSRSAAPCSPARVALERSSTAGLPSTPANAEDQTHPPPSTTRDVRGRCALYASNGVIAREEVVQRESHAQAVVQCVHRHRSASGDGGGVRAGIGDRTSARHVGYGYGYGYGETQRHRRRKRPGARADEKDARGRRGRTCTRGIDHQCITDGGGVARGTDGGSQRSASRSKAGARKTRGARKRRATAVVSPAGLETRAFVPCSPRRARVVVFGVESALWAFSGIVLSIGSRMSRPAARESEQRRARGGGKRNGYAARLPIRINASFVTVKPSCPRTTRVAARNRPLSAWLSFSEHLGCPQQSQIPPPPHRPAQGGNTQAAWHAFPYQYQGATRALAFLMHGDTTWKQPCSAVHPHRPVAQRGPYPPFFFPPSRFLLAIVRSCSSPPRAPRSREQFVAELAYAHKTLHAGVHPDLTPLATKREAGYGSARVVSVRSASGYVERGRWCFAPRVLALDVRVPDRIRGTGSARRSGARACGAGGMRELEVGEESEVRTARSNDGVQQVFACILVECRCVNTTEYHAMRPKLVLLSFAILLREFPVVAGRGQTRSSSSLGFPLLSVAFASRCPARLDRTRESLLIDKQTCVSGPTLQDYHSPL